MWWRALPAFSFGVHATALCIFEVVAQSKRKEKVPMKLSNNCAADAAAAAAGPCATIAINRQYRPRLRYPSIKLVGTGGLGRNGRPHLAGSGSLGWKVQRSDWVLPLRLAPLTAVEFKLDCGAPLHGRRCCHHPGARQPAPASLPSRRFAPAVRPLCSRTLVTAKHQSLQN